MEVSPKSILIDNLSFSVANLSLLTKRSLKTMLELPKVKKLNPTIQSLLQLLCTHRPPGLQSQAIKIQYLPVSTIKFRQFLLQVLPVEQNKAKRLQGMISWALQSLTEVSCYLQELIMAENPSVITQVLEWVTSQVSGFPLICSLMIDPYAFHVCSKLVDSCDKLQLGLLIENIVRDDKIFFHVSTNLHGAKLMKKFIRLLKGTSYSSLIVMRLSNLFNSLMTNQTGSYVINFCLDRIDTGDIIPLYEQAISQCLVLATHKIGSVSLNYVIDKIQGFHRQQLLELISINVVFLSQDPSGNHVVQKVLELENPIFNAVIGSMLRGHYVKLSMQKWGSHVVEKILKSPVAMQFGVEDFLCCGSRHLLQIAKDQFGNYAVQTALKVTQQRNRSLFLKLVKNLKPHASVLRFGYGKNIYNLVMNKSSNNVI